MGGQDNQPLEYAKPLLPPEKYLGLVQAMMALEQHYACKDARLKNLANRLEWIARDIRQWLADDELELAKRNLYQVLFPNQNPSEFLNRAFIDENTLCQAEIEQKQMPGHY